MLAAAVTGTVACPQPSGLLARLARLTRACFCPLEDALVQTKAAATYAAECRYERKFIVTELTYGEIRDVLRTHPSLFSEIYYERTINNVYLDSFSLNSYFDRVAGTPDSIKLRVRWYGELLGPIAGPALELKIRNGIFQRKERYRLADFTVDAGFSTTLLQGVFARSELPDPLARSVASLETVLVTRYRRSYFLSADGRFRVTIDTGLEYCSLGKNCNAFVGRVSDAATRVVELKYCRADDSTAAEVAGYFPFRLYRNSKYVEGLEKVNVW